MILIDNTFRRKHRDAVRLARKEPFTVKHLDQGLYFVCRKAEGHGKYIVTIQVTKSGIFTTCRRVYGGSCPSFGCCAHIAAWHERAVANGRRLQRKEQQVA